MVDTCQHLLRPPWQLSSQDLGHDCWQFRPVLWHKASKEAKLLVTGVNPEGNVHTNRMCFVQRSLCSLTWAGYLQPKPASNGTVKGEAYAPRIKLYPWFAWTCCQYLQLASFFWLTISNITNSSNSISDLISWYYIIWLIGCFGCFGCFLIGPDLWVLRSELPFSPMLKECSWGQAAGPACCRLRWKAQVPSTQSIAVQSNWHNDWGLQLVLPAGYPKSLVLKPCLPVSSSPISVKFQGLKRLIES